MSYCLNYLKYLSLAGFLLLGIFFIMICCEVETLKVKRKGKGMFVTGITSGVYFSIFYEWIFDDNLNL